MGNRVNASIAVGGQAPLGWRDALLDVIESERLGPDWGDSFATRDELVTYLQAKPHGPILYGVEVNGGEFGQLQAFCADHGLVYQLVYDGYGGEWGAGMRIRHADGTEETCSLDADGGDACITRGTIGHLALTGLDDVLAYLERFDRFLPPPLVFLDEPGAAPA